MPNDAGNTQNLSKVKISIVMPSYNQGCFIRRALQSVVDQQDPNYELIVMDGGSTDESVAVIKEFLPYITYWQSQRDNGQSAAINAGFRLATGDFKVWLNSDDILLPGALKNLRKMIAKYPNCRWFAGSTLWIDKNEVIIRSGRQESSCRLPKFKMPVPASPSSFMRADLLKEFGLLREDFHYMMDTELWYRFFQGGEKLRRIPGYTWAMTIHENAKTSGKYFTNSPLADKNHPSFAQKKKEREFLKQYEFFQSKAFWLLYYINKIFDFSIFSQFTDRKLLGRDIKGINIF